MGPGLPRDDDAETCALIPAARFRSGYANSLALSLRRGRREGRAPAAPVDPVRGAHGHPVCDRHTGKGYEYSQDIPAFPAQWFYGLYVLSPGKRPFLPPLLTENSAGVAPGSRRQDHTTSPYAAGASSGEGSPDASRVHRNPRQRFVTTAKRPLSRARDGSNLVRFCVKVNSYFRKTASRAVVGGNQLEIAGEIVAA